MGILELTDKQKLWFKLYTDSSNKKLFLNSTQCALKVYDTEDYNSARQIGVDNKKSMAPILKVWLDEEHFSDEALRSRLVGLMDAQETKFIHLRGKIEEGDLPEGFSLVGHGVTEKGEGEHAYTEYVTLVQVNMDAKETQRRSLDMALKVVGKYAADKVEISGLGSLADKLTKANDRVGREGQESENFEDDSMFD